jgi:hypothetical protein
MKSDNTFFFKLFVELTVLTILAVSIFSMFSMMKTGGWVAIILCIVWIIYRIYKKKTTLQLSEIKENKLIAILFLLCCISAAAGAHCFHDTYCYRLPQILFWMQKGRPWSVPNVDMRINQMPYVYPFFILPFFQLFGERGLAIPNLISFIIIWSTLKQICCLAYGNSKKLSWILLIFMSAPVIVMQASTNDNVLICCAFLMISTLLLIEKSKYSIIYSAFAFALCCGIKPQYLTLTPLWIAGVIAKSIELKEYKTYVLILLMPLLLLCSPVPTMGYNYFVNGSFMHPKIDTGNESNQSHNEPKTTKQKKSLMLVSVTLVNQLFAIPVNPIAGNITAQGQKVIRKYDFLQNKGLESVKVYLIVIAEHASLGLLAMTAMIVGFILPKTKNRKLKIICIGSFICLLISLIITRATTAGRSFIGFFLLMLPLAMGGLMSLKLRKLQIYGTICFFAGLLIIIINPAKPLWPVKFIIKNTTLPALEKQLSQYNLYSQRINIGYIMDYIPESEDKVGIIVNSAIPFARLCNQNIEIIPLTYNIDKETLLNMNINYIIVHQPHNALNSTMCLLKQTEGTIVYRTKHVSRMSDGLENWNIIKIQ